MKRIRVLRSINEGNGRVLRIPSWGYEIQLPGFKKYGFAIQHPPLQGKFLLEDKGWFVVHIKSGLSITGHTTSYKTIKQATDAALSRLRAEVKRAGPMYVHERLQRAEREGK